MIQILLQLTNINKSFNGINVLSNVNLSVRSGRVMALVGENGAGKSTLMKVLTGIYEKDAGEILYLGKKAHFSGPKSSQEAGIGIIHQELNLIHSLSIAENIFLGREFINKLGCIDWKKTYLKADELLNELNLTYDSRRLVSDLSIGEQQMVEIAKVLSFDSKVIIMDEPTDSLTDKETASLFNVIKKLKKKNCGIVYISHRLKEIFEICDDVTILRDGLFVAEKKVKDIDENALIEMMVGRKLNEQYPRIEKKRGDVILEIKNLKGNGINNVSFELYESEILGISGLMGSGRTELMKMIYGLNSVDSGLIILNGKKLKINSPKDALSNNIVYISEDRKKDGLILDMSVKNNMSLSALHYFVNVFKKLLLNKERIEVNNFVNLFNVKTHSIEQTIEFLSGGNQQKVSIAKGLMLKPKILILDEPTRGVDVGAKKEIYDLINQLKQDGLSVILVSSEMSEVLGMSDRILVMHEGNITGHFLRETATQEKLMAAAVGKQA